jgi:hypothetical protein
MAKQSSFISTLTLLGGIAGAAATYVFVLRPWHLRWGADAREVKQTLPGDELIPEARLKATHAVTIFAPSERIWPWLVQIGQGRGGFYSYDWLENLLGLNIHSAETVLPEHQGLQVGDLVPLAAEKAGQSFGIPVALLEPNQMLVLHGDTRVDEAAKGIALGDGFFAATWGWYLQPYGRRCTRLVERFRCDWNPSPANQVLMRVLMEPASFIMQRKMLLSIKERVERRAPGYIDLG